MFSMLNAIGEISNVANFTTPCVNIANSAFTQLHKAQVIASKLKSQPQCPDLSLEAQIQASGPKSQPQGPNPSHKALIPAYRPKSWI